MGANHSEHSELLELVINSSVIKQFLQIEIIKNNLQVRY